MKTKTKNKIVAIIFVLVFLICLSFIFLNPALTGFSIKDSSVDKMQKLELTSVCSDKPDVLRTWAAWNKNNVNIDFYWEVSDTNQTGFGIVMANGYAYFNTTTIEGKNIVRIFVNKIQQDTQVSKGEQCAIELEPCVESWSCTDWSACISGNQIRTCTDANVCNTTLNLPILIQSCSTPESCIENWICGGWSECLNSSQIRQCIDTNNCSTIIQVPELSQFCEENLTDINLTEQNLTEQNLTEPNQIGANNTTNQTAVNETIAQQSSENTASSSSSGGGSSSGGHSRSATMQNQSLTPSGNLNQSSFTNSTSEETKTEITESQQEQQGFIKLAGNAIRDLLSRADSNSRILVIILLVFVIAAGFIIRRRLRLRR